MTCSFSVFNEVKWTLVLLNRNKDSQNHAQSWKRCKVLLTTISNLKNHFLNDESKENIHSEIVKGKK